MNVRKDYIDIYYKRLLSRTGDLSKIELLINRLINIIYVIGKSIINSLIDKVPKEYLMWTNMFMMNFFSDTYGIYNAIARNTNVQEAYLYMMNFIERFIRIIIFYKKLLQGKIS